MIHNISRFIAALALMLTATTAWASAFSGGSGTEADPYKIANYSDLKTLHDNVNGGEAYDDKYFKQTADIDWPANTTWTSGIGTDADHRFGGHYDGDGKAIRRLTISGTSTYTGLFGYVRGASYGYGNFKQTTLKNIVLEDCDIDASSVSGSYAAGICAFIPNATRVDNCRVSGTISATSYASGITCIYEHSLTFVTNCFADVTVSALKIGKIFAEIPFSANIVGNYYHDNGDGVGSNGDSYYLTASEAAPLYTVSGSGFTTAATNATITHAGKHYFASGATVTLTTDDNHIITGSPAFSGTEATFYLATDRKSMTVTVGTSDVTVSVCSGTEDDPYLITNANDLQQLAAAVNNGERYDGKYFKQTADIDMTGKAMSPIGIGESRRFGGHYDGDGKAISHLTITGTTNYTALFGYICGASNGKDGYVSTSLKNIVLTDCDIDASSVSGSYAAGICAFTYKNTTVENCRVSGIIKGDNTAGGIVGEEGDGEVKNCFADVTVTASVQTGHYCTVGKIIGYVHSTSPVITGNYYHNDGATDAVGAAVTAFGKRGTTPHYDYSYATVLYTVSGTGLTTAATNATVTHAGTHYFAAGATVTLTTDDKLINDNLIINGMGASLGSVATDKKSMTVIVGTSDVTVSATLEVALCGDNAMWSISDTDGNGTYETLTISGSGAITSSPWDTDFASSIQRVNISSADLTINDNPFSTLGNDVIIVVPTPAYAVGYSSAAYATKLRVGVGSQLFKVTGTSAADAAYEIATEADLRNLAAAVYQDRQTCYGLTFRQTAPITLSGTFMPIGYCNYSNNTGEYFDGTYDGSGNTISGLSISGDYYAAGLFGVVTSGGAVKNVHLISPTVTSSMSGAYTGALIGSTNNCTVENCLVVNPTVRATASSIDNQVGALVGSLTYGTVQNCYVISPTVSGEGSTQVGAIFGNPYSFDHNLYCTLTNVYYYNSSLEAIGQHDNSEYSKVTNVGRAYTLTLGSGVTTNTAPAFSYNNVDYYYGTITLPAAPAGYIFTYTVNGNAISGNTFSISANSTVACTKSINSADFEQTGTNEYTIKTAAGWGVFCDALQDNDTYNRFSGKTVKLDADITVTRMAGSGDNPFCGNFDGGGNTLTFTAEAADNYCAPFVGVKGGTTADDATTIGNLNVVTTITANDYRHMAGLIALQWGHVNVSGINATVNISSTVGTSNPHDLYPAALVSQVSSSDGGTLTVSGCTTSGTISTDGKYAAGLVGIVQGTASISDCVSSVTIQSSTSGDGTHGGIVAAVTGSGSIEGCVFNGKLTTTKGTGNCAGFIAWGNGTISNSLYAPADLGTGETEVVAGTGDYPSGTFYRGTAPTVTNCYYTRALGTAQGKAPHTVTAGDNVTVEDIALTGGATAYTVSGITAYSKDSYYGGGLSCGDNLYYGSGDKVIVTLSNTAPAAPLGYQYGYTASAGTLSGSTLTMPDEDVTISVNTAALAPIDWATVNQGNSADPYMIYNKDQLLLLAHRVNGTNDETANTYEYMYFKLGADITFDPDDLTLDEGQSNYEAIGGYIGGTYRYFCGKFDGANHTVSGIRICKTGSGTANIYQGLFGRIGSGADIHDVHLTDARITGYESVGGIAGSNDEGYIMRCSVTDSYITATGKGNYGTICGVSTNTSRLRKNYYHGCTVNDTPVTSGKGCHGADLADYKGALPAYAIALGENITTPPGTFASQTEWLATPPVNPRLAPENGFTLAGNHYFASGYVFTPGSTLASGAAQGYTPRATLGGELLDPYTPTGDADPLAGTAIARLTVTADCDGKTLAAALRSTGQPVTVAYINADGTAGETSAIALDGTETSLAAGTYFAGLPTVNFDHTVNLTGNVTLILKDGCTMNVGTSGERINGYGIDGPDPGTGGFHDLTITSQSLGSDMGALSVYTTGNYKCGIRSGALTINGGNITADTDGNGAPALNAGGGALTINGGTVTATTAGTTAHAIAAAGDFKYNGGNVTATAPAANAIRADIGNYTFSWRTPADRITIGATGLYATAAKTATFIRLFKDAANPANYYGGTLTGDALNALAGKTLSGTDTLPLADDADNTPRLAAANAMTGLTVTLADRTLYKDGAWNTLCLPFDVVISGSALEGAVAREVTAASISGSTLNLTFSDPVDELEAGKPYIIKWEKTDGYVDDDAHNLVAPAFTGVTIDATDRSYDNEVEGDLRVRFLGTYKSTSFTAEDKSILLMGASNTLYYPTTGAGIGAQRAYFKIGDDNAGNARRMTSFNISFGEDETTGIKSIDNGQLIIDNEAGAWYTLDGRRLSGKPAKAGIYVNGGKKVMIK